MRESNRPGHVRRLGISMAALLFVAGCANRQRQEERETQILELRSQQQQGAEALARARAETQELERSLDAARDERDSAAATVSSLRANIESLEESAEKLRAENANSLAKFERSEGARESLLESLRTVQEQAAKNVEELADLRQRVSEDTEQLRGARATVEAVQKEFGRVNHELERARSEVATKESVIKSMSAGNDTQSMLGKTLAAAEADNRELVAKYEALAARLQARGEDVPSTPELGDAAPAGLAAAVAPASGFRELLEARGGAILRREAAWDGVDVMVVFGAVGLLLGAIGLVGLPWTLLRSRRLRGHVATLEQKVTAFARSERRERSATAREDRPRSAERGSIRRRGKFSPIISAASDGHPSPRLEDELEEIRDDEAGDFDEVTVSLGRMGGELPQPSDLVRQYQARAQEAAAPPSAAAWEDDEEDDDGSDGEFANTQIIRGLSDLDELDDAPPVIPAARKSSERKDDREFMAELKDLIGQKVDEMIR